MRWGHRKSEQTAISKRRSGLKRIRTMSDEEINKRIQRIQKEKQLRDLIELDTAPGRTAIKKLLKTTGAVVAGAALTGATMYTLHNLKNGFYKKTIESKMGSPKVTGMFKNGRYVVLDKPIIRPADKTITAFSFKKAMKAFDIGSMLDRMFAKKK